MIYITGDTHGDFRRIKEFCRLADTTAEDVIVILGDAGINYYGNESDGRLKYILSKLPVTLFVFTETMRCVLRSCRTMSR